MYKLKKYLMDIEPNRYITYMIRFFLVAVLGYFVIKYVADSFSHGINWPSSADGEIIFVTLLTLALTFTFDFLEKKQNIRIPHIISTTSVAFIFGGLFLGSAAGFYAAFWWWDDMLHFLSGIILGLIGFLLIYYVNSRFSMKLSPVFVGLFALSFAVFLGVVWEIFEFAVDALWGANMQRWMFGSDEFLIGKDYQGVGLRDTMSDLIVDMAGGVIAGLYAFYFYSHDRAKAIKVMRKTFGK